jgi:small-conductance mechanosensitive channel
MSFGFSIGDFIAAGELAFKVYQKVYMVAKNAPEAIKKLRDELAILSGAINILKGEIETPNSLVNNAGEMRKNMVAELIKNILSTLMELEGLSATHTSMSSEEISKTRQIWARVKWTKEARSVTTLVAKESPKH